MPTSADVVLVDTSVAIPLLDPDDLAHAAVHDATRGRRIGLAGHAAVETYSVLTRLPAPRRVSARAAAAILARTFPETCPAAAEVVDLTAEFAGLGIDGGAVYDGLVGAAARARSAVLLTRDARAERTYRLLGVQYRLL